MAKQQQAPTILPEFHGETDDWNVYREILDEFYRANGITGDGRVPVLISVIGKATYGTLRSLCHPVAPKDMKYEELCAVLVRQYIPEIAIFRHRAQFYRAEQRPGESVKEWYARLKALSMECKFDEALLEPLLIDRFVVGMVPGPVQNRLFEEQVDQLRSIDKAVSLAAGKEAELTAQGDGGDEALAYELAGLVIGEEMRHGGRHRRHGKHEHRHHGRHGHHPHHPHRHGHHHRHHGGPHLSDPEPGRKHQHYGPHGHHHAMQHPGLRYYGRPPFGPGAMHAHPHTVSRHHFGPGGGPYGFGYPGLLERFGRCGRGKWRKHHRRSPSSSSSSSSSSSNSSGSDSSKSSSSSSSGSDSEAPADKELKVRCKKGHKNCRKMEQHGKRHDFGKRHGHGRHHHRHHHHHRPEQDESDRKERCGRKGGCRRGRKQQEQEEPLIAEQAEQVDPTTEPELIE